MSPHYLPALRRKKADPEGTPMGHPAKLVEDAGYFEALEIRWERPVCPQVSSLAYREQHR